ncbi:hypothetical protein [Mycolicibacterium komossense]|uniref:Alkaline shock response membrane anchor protein AmaP n=1 Tax=Mycolicibacterium komossense TaxID=1779 RepID=A0ABT3CFK1_9MYCO|nr:hypothetical protein [Mycolicibacterium komossense]MCV7228016.1 hypothetical protein [Mycolicibacterium komossense]
MRRGIVIVDRLGCAVVGSALIALGVAAAAWERGDLPVPRGGALRIPWSAAAAASPWWPLALGAAAIALILVGLRWLYSHRPGQTLGSMSLPGSGATGQLSVDVNTVAAAAAAELGSHPLIAAATGTSLIDRGQRIVELELKIEPGAGSLSAAATGVKAVQRDLAQALDGVAFTNRVLLRTARVPKGTSRVN